TSLCPLPIWLNDPLTTPIESTRLPVGPSGADNCSLVTRGFAAFAPAFCKTLSVSLIGICFRQSSISFIPVMLRFSFIVQFSLHLQIASPRSSWFRYRNDLVNLSLEHHTHHFIDV